MGDIVANTGLHYADLDNHGEAMTYCLMVVGLLMLDDWEIHWAHKYARSFENKTILYEHHYRCMPIYRAKRKTEI